jgi:hypothetical protein
MDSLLNPSRSARLAALAALLALAPAAAQAQTAYGIDATGSLFSFNLSSPGTISSIGNLGFTPEAIDFRPGTSTLYAFDVTGSTARIYTIDTATAVATAIGAGFSTSGVTPGAYDFSDATSAAFDFNPTTLQGDGTIRIRLVGNDGTNLRLHSGTGGIAAVDGSINGAATTGIAAAAYTNTATARLNGLTLGTALFYVDSSSDSLLTTTLPNAGTVTTVGSLGGGVNLGTDVGFDIYSGGSSNTGYIVNTTAANVADFYSVDLATGTATPLGVIGRDFTGGFAIDQLSAIPEPASFAALAGLVGLGFAASRRRRSAA